MNTNNEPRYYSSIFLELRYIAQDELNHGIHKAYTVTRVIARDGSGETVAIDKAADDQATIASDYNCTCGLLVSWDGSDEMSGCPVHPPLLRRIKPTRTGAK